jgi:hypothetical protein
MTLGATSLEVRVFGITGDRILALELSNDESRLFCIDKSQRLIVWDTKTLRQVSLISCHADGTALLSIENTIFVDNRDERVFHSYSLATNLVSHLIERTSENGCGIGLLSDCLSTFCGYF